MILLIFWKKCCLLKNLVTLFNVIALLFKKLKLCISDSQIHYICNFIQVTYTFDSSLLGKIIMGGVNLFACFFN